MSRPLKKPLLVSTALGFFVFSFSISLSNCLAQSVSAVDPPRSVTNQETACIGNAANVKNVAQPILATALSSPLSGSFTIKVMNEYITRGIVAQGEGVTLQPILDLNYRLYHFTGFFNDLLLTTEFWNDISSNTKVSAAPTSTPYWTETLIRGGLSLGFAKYFLASTDFTQFLTPSNGYHEGRYIKTILSCNDTGLIFPNFSFRPQFTFLYELPDLGQPGLQPHAWWFEPGLTPNYNLFATSRYPVNFAIPFRIGLGRQFYNGTPYGFFSFGPQLSFPLAFISPSFGKWNLLASYTYYNLGTTTAAIAPEGNHNQNLFTAALGLVF
jgi:hypothetical protein